MTSHSESPSPSYWKKTPHKFRGSIDDDCNRCGYSIYMDWHTEEGFSQTEVGERINQLHREDKDDRRV